MPSANGMNHALIPFSLAANTLEKKMKLEAVQALVGDLSSALGAVKNWTNDKDMWVGEGHGWHFIAILYLSGCECTATKNGTVVRLPPELRTRVRDAINKQTKEAT